MSSPRDRAAPRGANGLLLVESTLRSVTSDDRDLARPPESIWDAIAAELAADEPGAPRGEEAAGGGVASIDDARARRTTRNRWFAVMAAAAVVVVVLGVVAVIVESDDDQARDLIATAPLSTLDTEEVVGSAELVDADGRLLVTLDLPESDPGDDYFELWLIKDATTGEMVSLGPVTGADATVPNGVDVTQYSVVDVSREPVDGDPTHSGDSIVRGQLAL